MADGTAIERLTLTGEGGFSAHVITHGAALQALFVPDRAGVLADVVLGHDDAAGYETNRDFYGATVGRFANRIAGAAFSLGGQPGGRQVRLDANEGANTLHGGRQGLDRAVFAVTDIVEGAEPAVVLTHTSPAGENGFPGTLEITVTWRIEGGRRLALDLEATTDEETVVNLTNHSFFNLAGVDQGGDVLGHTLRIDAERFAAIDAASIPTGALDPVEETPFDFRQATAIGARIRSGHPQLMIGRGYDHCFALAGTRGTLREVAALEDPASGRRMALHTTEAGLQFYSGNLLTGGAPGKGGRMARQSDALCLEPGTYPDSPNRPEFPSAWLLPGETYRHRIHYDFTPS